MVDSVPYPSDGETRAPRKHRHERSSGPRDGDHRAEDGYNSDRTASRNQHERSQNRHRGPDVYPEERTNSRHHDERSRGRYQERDRHHEERRTADRSQRERDGYREREKYPASRDRDGHQSERSSYEERERYPERDGYHHDRSRNWDRREQERYVHSVDKQRHPASSKGSDHYYPTERTFDPSDAQINDMEYYEPEPAGGILDCHKCRYLCTGRACCQLVEALLNMLILICCSVSYNSTGGYTGLADLGGIYYYQFGGAYSGLSGADGEKARALDVQFYQLKLPTVKASMAYGGALMTFSCLLVLLGVLRVPWRWPLLLLVECALDIAIAVGYVPALYFYFRYLQEAYNSQVCKDREALYSSKGYQGFTCALHGADIAAALFACMAILAFAASAWLAIKGFRTVRRMKKKPVSALEF